jgi:hypothetical protein
MNEIKNVMSRFGLLDISFVLRRGLVFFLWLIPLAALFAGTIFLTLRAFPNLPFYGILILAIGLAILLGLWSLPLWVPIQELVDRMFYRQTYAYRQILLRFSARMGNILALDQLSLEMVVVISKAFRISQTRLLLRDSISGDFVTRYKYPTAVDDLDKEPHLPGNGLITVWLQKESQPLNVRQIASIQKFSETGSGKSGVLANLDFLFPLKSHGKLVAILAIGKKQSKKPYSQEDLGLVMTATNQAGVILENALLYSELIQHTQELQTLNEKLMVIDKRRSESLTTLWQEIEPNLKANKNNLESILSEKYGSITNDQRAQLEIILGQENELGNLIEDTTKN